MAKVNLKAFLIMKNSHHSLIRTVTVFGSFSQLMKAHPYGTKNQKYAPTMSTGAVFHDQTPIPNTVSAYEGAIWEATKIAEITQ